MSFKVNDTEIIPTGTNMNSNNSQCKIFIDCDNAKKILNKLKEYDNNDKNNINFFITELDLNKLILENNIKLICKSLEINSPTTTEDKKKLDKSISTITDFVHFDNIIISKEYKATKDYLIMMRKNEVISQLKSLSKLLKSNHIKINTTIILQKCTDTSKLFQDCEHIKHYDYNYKQMIYNLRELICTKLTNDTNIKNKLKKMYNIIELKIFLDNETDINTILNYFNKNDTLNKLKLTATNTYDDKIKLVRTALTELIDNTDINEFIFSTIKYIINSSSNNTSNNTFNKTISNILNIIDKMHTENIILFNNISMAIINIESVFIILENYFLMYLNIFEAINNINKLLNIITIDPSYITAHQINYPILKKPIIIDVYIANIDIKYKNFNVVNNKNHKPTNNLEFKNLCILQAIKSKEKKHNTDCLQNGGNKHSKKHSKKHHKKYNKTHSKKHSVIMSGGNNNNNSSISTSSLC